MTYFIKSGNTFHVSPNAALDIRDTLPTGTYIVKFDERQSAYFLEGAESFGIMPEKIYGDTTKTADRVLRTYIDRTASTGVLLVGEKGSGKTMLAKMLSIKAAAAGIPTLIINTPFCGDVFNKFIQDIDQKCIVLFDEFEKNYDSDDQEQILTLLDGVFPQKKLFILTCNDVWKLDPNLKNRPGRIFYMLEYKGLDEAFVREYLNDNLKDKTQIEQFVKVTTSMFCSFNFDMMLALVQEMNRYDESLSEVMKFVNTKPTSDTTEYAVVVTDGDKVIDKFSPKIVSFDVWDPTDSEYIHVVKADDEYNAEANLELRPKYMTSVDIAAGTVTYFVSGRTVVLTKIRNNNGYNFMKALTF